MKYRDAKLNELLGKTILKIDGAEIDSDQIIFTCSDGSRYKMSHYYESNEYVYIEDICGDVEHLLNTPVTLAEDVSNLCDDMPPAADCLEDTYTWTWYKFATVKGYVTIRWYGTSSGYYSESVDFEQILAE